MSRPARGDAGLTGVVKLGCSYDITPFLDALRVADVAEVRLVLPRDAAGEVLPSSRSLAISFFPFFRVVMRVVHWYTA